MWDEQSTYINNPPYFEGFKVETEKPGDISEASALFYWEIQSPPTIFLLPEQSPKNILPVSI